VVVELVVGKISDREKLDCRPQRVFSALQNRNGWICLMWFENFSLPASALKRHAQSQNLPPPSNREADSPGLPRAPFRRLTPFLNKLHFAANEEATQQESQDSQRRELWPSPNRRCRLV